MILRALEATYAALRALYGRESNAPTLIMFLVISPPIFSVLSLMVRDATPWNFRLPTSTHSSVPMYTYVALALSYLFVAVFLDGRRAFIETTYARLPSIKPVKRRVMALAGLYLGFLAQAWIAFSHPYLTLGIFLAMYGTLGVFVQRFFAGGDGQGVP